MNDKTPRKNVSLALSGLLVTLSLLVTGCPYGGLPGGGGDGDTTSKLQDARIGLTIAGSTTTGNALVEAILVDDNARPVDLEDDQAIEVNDVELVRSSDGHYAATVPVADSYVLRVREPTRGVEETTLVTPTQFSITSPTEDETVSLSGFTITWDQVSAVFDTTVRLSQSVLGTNRSQTFGPATDSGTQAVTADDVPNWQYGDGVTLTISVVKKARQTNVSGFENADVSVELTTTVVVTPGP